MPPAGVREECSSLAAGVKPYAQTLGLHSIPLPSRKVVMGLILCHLGPEGTSPPPEDAFWLVPAKMAGGGHPGAGTLGQV